MSSYTAIRCVLLQQFLQKITTAELLTLSYSKIEFSSSFYDYYVLCLMSTSCFIIVLLTERGVIFNSFGGQIVYEPDDL